MPKIELPPAKGASLAKRIAYYQAPSGSENERDSLYRRRANLNKYVVDYASYGKLSSATYPDYVKFIKKQWIGYTPFSEEEYKILFKAEVARLPVIPSQPLADGTAFDYRFISKMLWWWRGKMSASWLRKFMTEKKPAIPNKFRKPYKTLYRVMKLKQSDLDALMSGRKLQLRLYSSWAPNLASVMAFAKLNFFTDRHQGGGNIVIFKVTPDPSKVYINLSQFMHSKEIRELAELMAYGWGSSHNHLAAIKHIIDDHDEQGKHIAEVVMEQFILTKKDIYSINGKKV